MRRQGRGIDRGQLRLRAWIVSGIWLAILCQASAMPPVTAWQEQDTFYEPTQIQVIRLQIDEQDLRRMVSALPERVFVPATFQWGALTIDNVGVRYKGNSSSIPEQQHKRGFLIKFNEFKKDHDFLGLQRVALDNGVQFGSVFSEPLITSILRDEGIIASRCNHAKLYINGNYEGIYVNIERVDEVFVRHHFVDGSGALYKVDEGGAGADWTPLPPDFQALVGNRLAFEPQSSSARRNASDVRELISRVSETPADEFTTVMETSIHLDAFLQTMAVMLFSGAFDQLTGWNPHNYYLYHHPQDSRWYYLPFDLDVGFADNAFGQVPVISGWNAAWPIPGGPPRPLIERIVDDPALLTRYRHLADGILEKHFHPAVLVPKVDAIYEQIKGDLASDPFPARRITNPEDRDYESIIASIKDFVRRRYDTARALLDNPGARPAVVRNMPHPGPGFRPGPQPGQPSADAPSELHVAVCSKTSVTLHWSDNASGVAAYIVQRAIGEHGQEFDNYMGQPGDDVTEAIDHHVAPGQTYHYRVYAIRLTPTGPQGTGVSNTIVVQVPER
ncbi:MAG: CotH kinase family protein [Pirellulaceae bacterium]